MNLDMFMPFTQIHNGSCERHPGPGMDKDRRVVVHTEFLFKVQAGGLVSFVIWEQPRVARHQDMGEDREAEWVHAPSPSATWTNQP